MFLFQFITKVTDSRYLFAKSGSSTLRVVVDRNNNSPVFNPPNYAINGLSENTVIPRVVETVTATDGDLQVK